ncbi:MAG: GNAT family N-acetyltransferase [Bacillota bacterium]
MEKNVLIKVRPIKKGEQPLIRRMLNRSFPFLTRLFVTFRGRDILVAEGNGKPLGGVILKSFYLPRRGKGGLVEWIFTAPEARGCGAGQKLLDAALKHFKQKKIAEVFAIIEGNNTDSINIFVSREFHILSPGQQLKRYGLNILPVWINTFHYMDVGHFLYVRPAEPQKDAPALQWWSGLLVSALIALLAMWRLNNFAQLDRRALTAVPLCFALVLGGREITMRLAAWLQGLKVRFRVWESGFFLNTLLAVFFGWFFPVPGSVYPRETGWKYREHAEKLGWVALAGSFFLLPAAWAVPVYRLLGNEPGYNLDIFAYIALFTAFFDLVLPFFPFSGYNGRRLWNWHPLIWLIPAVAVVVLFFVIGS